MMFLFVFYLLTWWHGLTDGQLILHTIDYYHDLPSAVSRIEPYNSAAAEGIDCICGFTFSNMIFVFRNTRGQSPCVIYSCSQIWMMSL